ncbi:ANTAR domain-containing protein [Paenarthrobacter sp. DKR-5]|uniref:ANTAR domain-containing protein n=1 Tax=Paenarthrobacter sp. DKR-5 TaxID=2835535 RepID=UPI001BDD0BC0|nr:ANTAR domain-containing protein [Paenarthrobacter sp. DKR-5]MBT1002289.1 ANTAR domain-containing protein [Paenarthrobacter sp. DKR-5]
MSGIDGGAPVGGELTRAGSEDILEDASISDVFQAMDTPQVLLDTDLVVCEVNHAYLRISHKSREALLGTELLRHFPGAPNDAQDDGNRNVAASFVRVLETGRSDSMWVQRYDIQTGPGSPEFQERYWSISNGPVFNRRGELVGILHHVEDVTELRSDLVRAIDYIRSGAVGNNSQEDARRFAEAAATATAHASLHRATQREAEQLREALTSRAVIDQAKGILMAEHRCDADEAFTLLSNMSMSTNVKVRDVASAIVYKTVLPKDARGGAATT